MKEFTLRRNSSIFEDDFLNSFNYFNSQVSRNNINYSPQINLYLNREFSNLRSRRNSIIEFSPFKDYSFHKESKEDNSEGKDRYSDLCKSLVQKTKLHIKSIKPAGSNIKSSNIPKETNYKDIIDRKKYDIYDYQNPNICRISFYPKTFMMKREIINQNLPSLSPIFIANKKTGLSLRTKKIKKIKEFNLDKETFQCHICFKKFEKSQSLGGHMSSKHPGTSESFTNRIISANERILEKERNTFMKSHIKEIHEKLVNIKSLI